MNNTDKTLLIIGYTNYKGEFSIRRIRPIRVYFGSNEWHPEEQWLMDAWDEDKQAERGFAMKDCVMADAARPTEFDTLIDRLEGRYGIGPHIQNGDPEFGWRQFQTTPINREAAAALRLQQAKLKQLMKELYPRRSVGISDEIQNQSHEE